MRINFDMDGTIANLYGVDNWLEYLENENTYPYEVASPLVRLSNLARVLNRLRAEGFELGIISWLSKNSTEEYEREVEFAKRKWLATHMPSVVWDSIAIVPYGTPKRLFCTSEDDILFDDEERNRAEWAGRAYDVNNIMEILKTL